MAGDRDETTASSATTATFARDIPTSSLRPIGQIIETGGLETALPRSAVEDPTRGLPNRESGLRDRVIERLAVFETASQCLAREPETGAGRPAIPQTASRLQRPSLTELPICVPNRQSHRQSSTALLDAALSDRRVRVDSKGHSD